MRSIVAAVCFVSLLFSCRERVPPGNKYEQEDQSVLSAAIEFVYEKVCIPDSLRSNEKSLIICRQSKPIKVCASLKDPNIVLDEHGYLKLNKRDRDKSPDFIVNCLPSEAIRRLLSKHHSLGTSIFMRNEIGAIIPRIVTRHPIKMLERGRIKKLIHDCWWDGLFKTYPDTAGVLELSMPGYSADGQYACVYLEFGCGGLWASGWAVLLKGAGSEWKWIDSVNAWVS